MWLTATMQFWSSSWRGLLELCVRLFLTVCPSRPVTKNSGHLLPANCARRSVSIARGVDFASKVPFRIPRGLASSVTCELTGRPVYLSRAPRLRRTIFCLYALRTRLAVALLPRSIEVVYEPSNRFGPKHGEHRKVLFCPGVIFNERGSL